MNEVGNFIRTQRARRGWTLRDLAERCALSVSFLSQVERGLSSPSITSLDTICRALGISLSDFFSKHSEGMDTSTLSEIATSEDNACIQLSSASIKYRFLSGDFPGRLFEILIGEIPPNYHYPPVAHEGEEFGYVLEGNLKLKINKETHELGPGDSYHFMATTPHGYETDEQQGAKILWVQTLKYSGTPFRSRKRQSSSG